MIMSGFLLLKALMIFLAAKLVESFTTKPRERHVIGAYDVGVAARFLKYGIAPPPQRTTAGNQNGSIQPSFPVILAAACARE